MRAPDLFMCLLIVLTISSYAWADISILEPKDKHKGKSGRPAVAILINGQISKADATKLAAFFANKQLELEENRLWLDSPGGDMDAAMDMGRILDRNTVAAFVDKNSSCLSACVLVAMGAESRVIGGKVGIHRPYSLEPSDDYARVEASYRKLQKRVRQYVADLDFPAQLYDEMMAVPPEDVKLLSAAELKKYYLEGRTPAKEDSVDSAYAKHYGITKQEWLQRKVRIQACGRTQDVGACIGNAIDGRN